MNSSSSILSPGVPTRQNMLKEVEMKMVKTFTLQKKVYIVWHHPWIGQTVTTVPQPLGSKQTFSVDKKEHISFQRNKTVLKCSLV